MILNFELVSFDYKLYNGIERNPNAAGSGLINFGCSKLCPTNCESSKFKFWNKNNEDFDLDTSLRLVCSDIGKTKIEENKYKTNYQII